MTAKAKTQVTSPPPAVTMEAAGGKSLFEGPESQPDNEGVLESGGRQIAASDPPEDSLQRAEAHGHHFEQVAVASYRSAAIAPRQIQAQPMEGIQERWEDGAVSLKAMAGPLAMQVSPTDEKWEDGAVTLKADPSRIRAANGSQLQRTGEGSFAAGSQIEGRLKNNKGGGKPLSNSTRDFMESRFGNDFGQVRIHDNAESVQMNQDLRAQAFTHGNDIYFNSGKYNPESSGGKRLLAHELTHTIQQTGPSTVNPKRLAKKARKVNKRSPDQTSHPADGTVAPKLQLQKISQVATRPVGSLEEVTLTLQPELEIGSVGDRYEQEADRMADHVMQFSRADETDEDAIQRSDAEETETEDAEDAEVERQEADGEIVLEPSQETIQRSPASNSKFKIQNSKFEPPQDTIQRSSQIPPFSLLLSPFPLPSPLLQRDKKDDVKKDVAEGVKGIDQEINSKKTGESDTSVADKGGEAGRKMADEAKNKLGNADSEDKAKDAAKDLEKKSEQQSQQTQEEGKKTGEDAAKKKAGDAKQAEEKALEEKATQEKASEEAEAEAVPVEPEAPAADGAAESGEASPELTPIGIPEQLPDPGPVTAPEVSQPKTPMSPDEDPAFAAVVKQSEHVASQQSVHKPAVDKAREAQDAANDPAQQSRRAQATQSEEAAGKQPQLFDRATFVNSLLAVLEANKPKSQKDIEEGKGMEGSSEKVTEEVSKAKEKSGGELTESSTRAPDPAVEEPKPVTLPPEAVEEAGEKPPAELIDPAAATPKPKSEEEVEKPLEQTKQAIDTLVPKDKKDLPPIQAKLMVGAPGDKYEQEADRMADAVMAMAEPTAPAPEPKSLATPPKTNKRAPAQAMATGQEGAAAPAQEQPQATIQSQTESSETENVGSEAAADSEAEVQRQPEMTLLPDIQLFPGVFLQRQAVLEADAPSQAKNPIPLDENRLKTYEKEAGVDASGAIQEGQDHFGGGAQKTFRQSEASTQADTQKAQTENIAAGNDDMFAARMQEMLNVQDTQQQGQTEDEAERQRVSQEIQTIYDETKGNVNGILGRMDARVKGEFEATDKRAKAVFEARQKQLFAQWKHNYYRVRNPMYLPWMEIKTGWAYIKIRFYMKPFFNTPLWLVNKVFTGLPDEVNQIYEVAKEDYLAVQREGVHRIADIVEEELTNAKTEVDRGRQRVQEYVAALPDDLRSVGMDAAASVQAQFDTLEQTIRDKQTALVDDLKAKYAESLKEVNDRIEELKAANASLVSKIAKALAEVGKWILRQVVNLLKPPISLIPGIGSKVNEFLDAFVDDPGGVMNTLFTGIGEGFKNFGNNILKHVINGFFEWLLGSGIQIKFPDKFDLQGVIDILLQVLGLTKDAIFTLAASLMPEWAVELLRMLIEQGLGVLSDLTETLKELGVPDYVMGFFKAIADFPKKGFIALWDFIKDVFASLKGEFITMIITQLVIPEIAIAGIQYVIGLLSPATGILKIVKMIVDVIIFLIRNRAMIFEVLKSIADVFAAVAAKTWQPVAKAVEMALAKIIPLALGFFASLLGLGGIPQKIGKVVEKLRTPVDKGLGGLFGKLGMLLDPVGAIEGGVGGLKGRKKKKKKNKNNSNNKNKETQNKGKKPASTKDKPPPKKSNKDKNKNKKDKKEKDKGKEDNAKKRLKAAMSAVARVADQKRDPKDVKKDLKKIKKKHKLDSLKLTKKGKNKYRVTGTAKAKKGKKKTARRQAIPGASPSLNVQPQVESEIDQQAGKGDRLTDRIQTQMESAFGGADFSGVRVHADAEGDRLSRSLNAEAFTVDRDIYFRQGRYAPESPSGKRLLAHELTHVQQQQTGHQIGVAQRKSSKKSDWKDKDNEIKVKKKLKGNKKKANFTLNAELIDQDDVLKKVQKKLKPYIKQNPDIKKVKRYAKKLKKQYKLKSLRVIKKKPDGSKFQVLGEVKKKGKSAQRKLAPGASSQSYVNPHLETDIQRAEGRGQEMASTVRSPLETAFGVDFSPVRIHTGNEGDRLSRAMNAKAFTTGRDIFFRRGAYEPETDSGQHLLAHELTHVVQQSAASPSVMNQRVQRQPADPPPVQRSPDRPGLWIQREAEENADEGGAPEAGSGMATALAGAAASMAMEQAMSGGLPGRKKKDVTVRSRITNKNTRLSINVKVEDPDDEGRQLPEITEPDVPEEKERDEEGLPPSLVNDIVQVIQDIVNQDPDPEVVSRKLDKVRVMFEMQLVKLVTYSEVGDAFEYVVKINGRAKFIRASKIASFLKGLAGKKRKGSAKTPKAPNKVSDRPSIKTAEPLSAEPSTASITNAPEAKPEKPKTATPAEKPSSPTASESNKPSDPSFSPAKVKPSSTEKKDTSKDKIDQAQNRKVNIKSKIRRLDPETVDVIIRATPQAQKKS